MSKPYEWHYTPWQKFVELLRRVFGWAVIIFVVLVVAEAIITGITSDSPSAPSCYDTGYEVGRACYDYEIENPGVRIPVAPDDNDPYR
jgi:hypothetical protein